ncbi:hypothetical protein KYB31_12360 [Clostridium felsineum]|uniref:hypothetical protein n=1 Tax=Clostridium felsineum TaxID=36839 RepID=UPI00214D3F36|nr:hypothetical protein [Clostridium felsineum]MCR3759766.1 hypothetical protein [Clostridium felsineum]
MEKFLKKYSPSSLFALICAIEFGIVLNFHFSNIVFDFVFFTAPVILIVFVGYVNCKRYLKMKLWQVLKYILVSFLIYILSIIPFFLLEGNIERMFHELDDENMGGAILLGIVLIEFTKSIFIAYLVPIIFKFIVYLKRIYDKRRINN